MLVESLAMTFFLFAFFFLGGRSAAARAAAAEARMSAWKQRATLQPLWDYSEAFRDAALKQDKLLTV